MKSEIYSESLPELLTVLSDDLNGKTLGRALTILRNALDCSRVYLLRLASDGSTLQLVTETRKDDSIVPLDPDLSYPANKEQGWGDVGGNSLIDARDTRDPATIAKYGLNTELNDMLDVRSLYSVRFASEGRNWGALGITYERAPRTLEADGWEFLSLAAKMLQLSIVRNDRLVALQEERDRARAAETAKSYFFSTVSHDIRTPLNAIIGYAELLKLGIADEAERKKAIDSLLVSGHTLLELINDVLDLSKLEAGRMEIVPEPVDVARLIREVAESFRASIGEKPVEIRCEVHSMPWLKLDPHRVRQLLFNLVGNAVKFTSKGYVEITAAYDRGPDRRGTFRFEVADTGCGISVEDQLRIAQPYVQVGNSASRHKGTGLGLAICRHLVTKMDGELEMKSHLGKGTTFYVTLTGVEEEDGSRIARLTATQRIRYAVSEKASEIRRVLLVDDQPMNLMVLKTMLSRFGISDIETSGNGREALEKLRTGPAFDIVLTDMWMPEMDGEALVKEIRSDSAWDSLPVYAVTADVEAQKGYAELGFTGILLKPITLEKLKGIIHAN